MTHDLPWTDQHLVISTRIEKCPLGTLGMLVPVNKSVFLHSPAAAKASMSSWIVTFNRLTDDNRCNLAPLREQIFYYLNPLLIA
jgi:hypothetical protein